MRRARCERPAEGASRPSLRSNFAWTFAANALYGASQWAILSLIAKLGSGQMLGEYALAVAIASPVSMLTHLNLRAVLATDVDERHAFGDYLAVRYIVTLVGLAVISILALFTAGNAHTAAATMLAGIALGSEQISDIYYGPLQRRERMDLIAQSLSARAVLSVVALGLALWWTRELLPALVALALGRFAVLLLYDRPRGRSGERMQRTGREAEIEIFRTAIPLGIVLMLSSLTANLPRYAIERHVGIAALGAFAATASFINVGNAVIQALGQSALPRLARFFSGRDYAAFRKLILRICCLALFIGVAGVITAVLIGDFALAVLYRPEYARYQRVLVEVMAAGICMYTAIALGYAATSARWFRAQMILLCVVAAVCAAASELLVRPLGLTGAALALAIAACVQIAGYLIILRSIPASEAPA